MAWTATITWNTGDIVTAAHGNAYWRDNEDYLKTNLEAHHTRHENGGADEISVAGLSGELADNQPPKTHGASAHTDIPRTMFIPAVGYNTGAITSLNYGTVTALSDGVVDSACFYFKMPSDYFSNAILYAVWESGAASGNMYWKIDTQFGESGEPYDADGEATSLGVTATGGAKIINVQEPSDPPDLLSITADDYVGVRVTRDASHANDTLNATVELLGILLVYTANQ